MVNLYGMERPLRAALMARSKGLTCVKMSTHFCTWYRFLACTKPPDRVHTVEGNLTRRNRMPSAATAKSRHNTPLASEEDEKIPTAENEKTNAGVTTAEYSRRT